MNRQAHVIRRQTLELVIADRVDAPRLQAEVQRLFDERVLPVMDEVMSSVVPADEVLRIERLELELGRLDAAGMEEQLSERIQHRLDEALTYELRQAVDRDAMSPVGDRQQAEPGPPARSSPTRSTLEALEHFLRTGLVPWWHPLDGFDVDRHCAKLLVDHRDALLQLLRRLPAERTANRLVKQLRRPTLDHLLQHLIPAGDAWLVSAAQAYRVDAAVVSGTHQADDLLPLYQGLLVQLLRFHPSTQRALLEVIDKTLSALVATRADTAGSFIAQLMQAAGMDRPGDGPLHRQLLALQQQINSRISASAPDHERAQRSEPPVPLIPANGATAPSTADPSRRSSALPTDAAADARAGGFTANPEISGASPTQGPRPAQTRVPPTARAVPQPQSDGRRADPVSRDIASPDAELMEQVPDLAQGHYLHNAGLVLLWPYLPRFFQQLGLADRLDFRSGADRERAVLLLEYLVEGETALYESRLPLNKVLCGWPLLEPVASEIEPTEQEAREADELLASVIGHWQLLKNTSRDGLREAFLMREGRLSYDDMGWQLVVSRMAYDVLLDSLPWAIGLIRLPWMQDALRVEW